MAGLAPTRSDAEIPDNMTPQMDLNVDWIQIRKTPAGKVDIAKEDLRMQRGSNLNTQHQIKDFDLYTLNREQLFVANIIQQDMDSQTFIIIVGGPGTKKSAVVKAVTNILNENIQNSMSVLCLGTIGTDAFLISGATCHYF